MRQHSSSRKDNVTLNPETAQDLQGVGHVSAQKNRDRVLVRALSRDLDSSALGDTQGTDRDPVGVSQDHRDTEVVLCLMMI
jgi:hypothetical protein